MFLESDLAPVVTAGLVGGCNVDGGPTDEQWLVIESITTSLLGAPNLNPRVLTPLEPNEIATRLSDPVARRRFHELLVAVEACRHPLTEAQVARVETYAAALDINTVDLELFRSFVNNGVTRASADFARFLDENLSHRYEPQLAAMPVVADRPEPELAARLEALENCAEGTLGHGLLGFYRRWNLAIPGREPSKMNHFYVSHDMTHVIAGIEATAAGEIALSAFQMAMNDNTTNTSALLASLIVHEAGFGDAGKVRGEAGILAEPAAARLFGEELARGSACTGDFSLIDHLAMVDRPIAEIREEFGVMAPANPNDGHHYW